MSGEWKVVNRRSALNHAVDIEKASLAAGGPKVLALDPGVTTGWCLIEPRLDWLTKNVVTLDREGMHWGQVDCGARQGELVDNDLGDALQGIGNGMNPDGESRGVARLLRLIDENPTVAIVVEDFIVDFKQITKARDALSPVRVTAKLEQALWDRGLHIHLQERSNPKVSMNNDRLRELGLLSDTAGQPHARDAMRHAMYFIRRCINSPELRHSAWPWCFADVPVKPKRKREKKQGERIVFGD